MPVAGILLVYHFQSQLVQSHLIFEGSLINEQIIPSPKLLINLFDQCVQLYSIHFSTNVKYVIVHLI